MSDQPELTLIRNEIERLEKQSGERSNGLSLEDVRKLEILIKTRKLVLGEPTEITQNTSKPKEKMSDAAVLKLLKPKAKPKRAKANGKSKKTTSK